MPAVELPTDEEILAATDILIRACHGRSWNSGWWRDPRTGAALDRNHGEMIALAHSELSEALEGHRRNLADDKLPAYPMEAVELCDCIIRCADMLGGFHYPDAVGALAAKLRYNSERADHKPATRAAADGKRY
jgi:hypothetical protein